ncbi:hypothetical protein [Marinibactrum halimedae]|uniref:Uncharacterized protein n=1 Tax=Marinibactrum halimedae TaxID=1444977 RepID=A0AA37T731_9GAMM|nr:hypothetical protein [Marinibactrum halimedae]MCD9457700.1 hypothetical protein [Marinibactrum halimedae]GLS24926.1 hypothetical protein GCM10007877_06400 [Marinibactrum halimedae]
MRIHDNIIIEALGYLKKIQKPEDFDSWKFGSHSGMGYDEQFSKLIQDFNKAVDNNT